MVENHPDGKGEVVTELAGPLPLQIICDMMGIPDEDHQRIFHWTNVILGFGDPDLTTDFDEFVKVAMDIGAYASALAEDRRRNPGDNLTTSLVQAEVDVPMARVRAWFSRDCAALRSTRSSNSSARRGSRSSPTGRSSGSRSSG